jgi:hypothetical protein
MKASCRGASKPFLVCRSKELALRTISFHRLSLVVAASAALMMPGSNVDAQPAAPTGTNPHLAVYGGEWPHAALRHGVSPDIMQIGGNDGYTTRD